MKEAYVSFEVAKLLKEKGFNWECRTCYEHGELKTEVCRQYVDWNGRHEVWELMSAPTHQMACAWLREIKNIVIIPEIHTTTDPKDYYWGASIYYLDKPWDLVKWISEPSKGKCNGYDEVIEAALKYSLENLL